MPARFVCYSTTLILTLFLVSAATAQEKTIMVVNSYHAEYPWVKAHNDALKNKLAGKATISFHYLDAKRQPLKEARKNADTIIASLNEKQPDIVVLADDFALKEMGIPIMQRGIPVVFMGINGNPRHYLGPMTLATGVLERPLLKRSIAYIKDILREKLHKCLILFDNKTTAKVIVETVFLNRYSSTFSTIDTDIKLHSTFAQWKKSVMNAKENGYDVIILGLYHTLKDDEGNHVPDEEVANWTSAHSPVPVFGFWDFSIGKNKAIGGLVLSGAPQGVEAANIINKILSGQNPQMIQPVTAEHGRFVFSKSGLRSWAIILPEYFRDPKEPIEFIE